MASQWKPPAVPNHQPHDGLQRLLEFMTGIAPFLFLAILIILSRYALTAAAVVLLLYTLSWLVRLFGYSYRLVVSYYYLRLSMLIDWQAKLEDINAQTQVATKPEGFWPNRAERWYQRFLASGLEPKDRLDPKSIYQAIIIAVSNEPLKVIEPSLKAIIESCYDHQKMILIIAYEQRGGAEVAINCQHLADKYGRKLKHVMAIKHPDNLPGEAKAKAGNITYAGKYLSKYCRQQKIKAKNVLLTTLDADNRPHPQYLAGLAWTYSLSADRAHRSYQPIPLFTNNIWDAPAIVRVLSADTSFWYLIQAMQPKRLRLFSAHAQSLQTIEDTDYWNVEVVVEDGHQYWRTYFCYQGDHYALPLWLPIYQDAVLSTTYFKTIFAQFRQFRRWSWGVADTPWLIRQSFRDKSISWPNKLIHIIRQFDDYIAWSTAPIVLAIGGWLPRLLSPDASQKIAAHTLPEIISGLQVFALIAFLIAIAISVWNLPPKPPHHGYLRGVSMVLQWALEPIALIGFFSLASLSAHFRLIINKPLETFNTTEKHHYEKSTS